MNETRTNEPAAARMRTLLYIEDKPAHLKMIEKIIARHPDMRLLTAENGKKGVAMAHALRPDVIVMDINLPDISGFKALEILRADPLTALIPVIALSGNDTPLNVESGSEAGFFRYLTKPIDIQIFMNVLEMALEDAARIQQTKLRERHVP